MAKKIILKSSEASEKNAEKIQQIMESSLGEHFKQIAKFQEVANQLAKTMVPTIKPIQEAISRLNDSGIFHSIEKMRSLYAELFNPPVFPVEHLSYLPPADEIIQEALEKSVEVGIVQPLDLIWNSKEKILSRTVPGLTLKSFFKGGEAKRMNLLEKLIKSRGYVESRDLQEFLGCPTTEAVRKLKQGINKRIRRDLDITEDVIEGRGGFGYRISPLISIHQS